MKTGGHRHSANFEDRGSRAGRGGGGLPEQALSGIVRMLRLKGTLAVGAVVGVGYFMLPAAL